MCSVNYCKAWLTLFHKTLYWYKKKMPQVLLLLSNKFSLFKKCATILGLQEFKHVQSSYETSYNFETVLFGTSLG